MTNVKASQIFFRENSIFLIVLLIIALLYILFPTKNFYWDGIFFSESVESARSLNAGLFHPNHLFYNAAGYLGYAVLRFAEFPVRAVYVFQYLSIFLGIGSAVVVFKILKTIVRSSYVSVALTAIFAFSAAYWKYATDADAYIPSIFFLLVSFYLILPEKQPRSLTVALTHAAAMFFHELAVIFFPVVILGLFFQTADADFIKTRFLTILKYAAGVFVLTFGTYCACFYLQTGSFEVKDFFRWITFYTTENGFSEQNLSNLQLTLRGSRQLFFNGAAGFQSRDIWNIILLIFLAVSVIVFLFQTGRHFFDVKVFGKKLIESKAYFQPVILLCAVWIAPYLLFLFYFIPANTFYRLFYFPALIILAGALFAPFELANPLRHWRLALFASIMACSNFLFYIRPQAQIRENTPLALAAEANKIWTAQTTVYFDALDTDNRIVRYFTPAAVWKPLDSIAPEEFEKQVADAYQNGGSVWLEATAARKYSESPETSQFFKGNAVLELKNAAENVKFIQILPAAKN